MQAEACGLCLLSTLLTFLGQGFGIAQDRNEVRASRVLVAHVQLLDWGANIWEREKARLGVLGVLGCMNNISLPL